MIRHFKAFTLSLSIGASGVMAQVDIPVKQVSAPASDITSGVVALPDVMDLGERSTTLLIEIDPDSADANGVVELVAPIGDGRGRVVFLPAQEDAWVGEVASIDANTQRETRVRTDSPIEHPGVSLVRHALPWGDDARVYPALILAENQREMSIRVRLNERVGGFVLIDGVPDRALYTYVKQRRTIVDEPITLASSLSDGSRIGSLRMVVRAPDGSIERIESDLRSREMTFTPTQPGAYAVQVFASYIDADRRPISLSTQHLIQVERPAAPLGQARVRVQGDQIEIRFDDAGSDGRTIVAAEVWGRNKDGMIPVCWLSRVCDADRSLLLDPMRVIDAGIDPATIELRQVRVHDVDSLVPVALIEQMRAPADVSMIERALRSRTRAQATQVSIDGMGAGSRGVLPGGHRLLLVHGYCSDGNPFTTSHFTGDIAVFNDPAVSRSTDAFALEILAQASPMKSFGVVAHSQGAMAALHLYTYYFSGLDWARGDRLIQSVGAPYQGTALAGSAAVLGDVFGFGCGENPDMTYTGAANWLSLIPTSSREQVWYYTTSFEDRVFVYDYCNIVTDLLLDDPDDGVIERSAGQLPGANNMGHVEDWCHTTGMRDPAQCTDASRNATMNARARR